MRILPQKIQKRFLKHGAKSKGLWAWGMECGYADQRIRIINLEIEQKVSNTSIGIQINDSTIKRHRLGQMHNCFSVDC